MRKCMICGKDIKNAGAEVSHMRVHVRRNEAIECKDGLGKVAFKPVAKEEPKEEGPGPFALIGDEPVYGQPHKVWEIQIKKLRPIDPANYFITTGDAVIKAEQLLKDLRTLSDEVHKLHKKLIKSKAESKYLETAWKDHRLLAKRKDPRRKVQQELEINKG